MAENRKKLAVVGSMNGSIIIYDAPEYRKPKAGEVVEFRGGFWRILNPDGCGQQDVTRTFIQAWKEHDDFNRDGIEAQAELDATYDAFLVGTGRT